MQNKFSLEAIGMCAIVIMLGFTTQARSFEFKQFKATGSKANSEYYWMGTEKSKSALYRIKIGGASKIDDTSEMEIRAATVFKNVTDRKTGVNDIAKFKFDPIHKGKPIYFMVSSGAAFMVERDNDYWYGGNDGRANKGWQLAGCIIEIWQKGKVVKHWSGAAGGGKTRLTDGIPLLRINKDGRPSDTERFSRDFDNATEIFSVDEKGERVDIEDVLQPYRENEGDEKANAGKTSSAKAPAINAVASKLRQCDFLRNERFKKNAKFYLCLFSASWCPPCRREMPRIAKTYAETLKNDPDIELIHFSRDQDEEKAMAWAKEHDVKFPVVKPRGGNPLDLHTRGIPHLFIVKADGTLIEEGHPMNIFNEEKFSEIKGVSTMGARETNADTCDVVSSNDMTGPYGIRMQPDPGCEKGALYVLQRLKDVYLPAAVRYYGDPFGGREPTRVFTLHVKRNDGTGNRKYTGVSWGSCSDGIDSFTIGLAKGSDKWEMDLPLVASKVLTVCSESDSAAFSIYANDFVRGEVGHYDPIPKIKEDIREGLRLRGEAEDKVKGRPWVLRKLAPTWAAFEELREKHPTLVLDYCNLKNSKYAKGELSQKISADQMVALMGEVTGVDAAAIFKKHSAASVASTPQGKIAVSEKLGQCDFLLNKDFKKNAKFYLCLFSASWCGPCRAEMPRIAKTYAETLKDDPDIELIHFSRDQDEEKALAWAKEHDVKFPVVKPNGGNPLDLHSRGIPHLFIVKADGTVLEEGHPMRIFNEEKFGELKGGGATDGVKPQDDKAYAKRTVNGGDSPVSAKSRDYSKGEKGAATVDNITWSYSIQGGEATIVSPTGKLYERAVTPQPVGDIAIPPSVNGTPVTGIGKFALCNCSELASVRIPNSVKHIDEWAFSGCRKLTSVTVPSSVDNIGKCVFASCPRLVEINVEAGNSKYVAVDGVVYTRDMKRLVTGVGGLMSVNVPPGVEEIDREAFRCCRELKSVTMPLSVKTIGREAFLASGLESVIVPSSVSRIEPWAFWCCTGLRSVTIHEGVAIIGNQAFYQCRNLKEVLVPTSVKYIEADAFKDCRELVSVTMSGERPDTRGSIFEKCDKLAAIHVSANAKSWAGMKEWQGIPLVFDAEAK